MSNPSVFRSGWRREEFPHQADYRRMYSGIAAHPLYGCSSGSAIGPFAKDNGQRKLVAIDKGLSAVTASKPRWKPYAIARVLIDSEVNQCAKEIVDRWSARLDDVDVWAASHCRTALVYYEWDVGPAGRD